MYKVVSIKGKKIQSAINGADMLEIRFDHMSEKTGKEMMKKTKKPVIYKMEKFNEECLKEEIIKKSKYADVDVSASENFIKKIKKINPKIKIIISYHNHKVTPYQKELEKIYKKMIKQSPDIVKFATFAENITDSFRMLDFLSSLRNKGKKAVCLCMGKHGYLTRITGHLFGNYMMYFAADKKSVVSQGQITIKEFKQLIP